MKISNAFFRVFILCVSVTVVSLAIAFQMHFHYTIFAYEFIQPGHMFERINVFRLQVSLKFAFSAMEFDIWIQP